MEPTNSIWKLGNGDIGIRLAQVPALTCGPGDYRRLARRICRCRHLEGAPCSEAQPGKEHRKSTEILFQPSYFVAAIRSGLGHREDSGHERVLRRYRGKGRRLSIATDSFSCHFLVSPTTSVTTHEVDDDDVVVVLHGELYPDSGVTPAARCLEAYLKEGMSFVAQLHGSFGLAVIDKRADRVWFATDPVNSRKLFCGYHGGFTWISTMQTFHLHPSVGKPDVAGIAHYLINGIPLNNRTLIAGVRVLDRAAVHEFGNRGLEAKPYWHFDFDPRPETSEARLREELQQALRDAVQRRLPTNAPVFLSLSAGYDSTCILGLLKSVGAGDVHCFSYITKSGVPEDEDAYISREAALGQGYRHVIVPGYGDDLATVIQDNIRYGEGITRLVVETDVWRTIGESMAAEAPATVWVGDAIGMRFRGEIRTSEEVLWSLGFGDWESLGRIGHLMPEEISQPLKEAVNADLHNMLYRKRDIEDMYFLRDVLYVDQGLLRILSFRETFAGQYAEVRNPLLDTGILDLHRRTPTSLRRGRRLYRETVVAMYPDLFMVPRAPGGWVAGRWMMQQVGAGVPAIREFLNSSPSPLDEYVPPDFLLRLASRQGSVYAQSRKRARRAAGRLRRRIRPARHVSAPPQLHKKKIDASVFLVRALFLREFLSGRLQD